MSILQNQNISKKTVKRMKSKRRFWKSVDEFRILRALI